MLEQFFRESTIHGLRYLVPGTGKTFRLLWLLILSVCFISAAYFIYLNVLGWMESPTVVLSVDETKIDVMSTAVKYFYAHNL